MNHRPQRNYEPDNLPAGSRRMDPEYVYHLPIGTKVYVGFGRNARPYEVVRWGRRRLRRLKYIPHMDSIFGNPDEYLPIGRQYRLRYYV